ncbi:MAG: 50S ribosomal protein L23 [Verrucomicrobia bacterium]|jgi:large subunit ribosomal protein L23|nr:50S ribosomal protein L23 [Verrucomicrobiota bacterium]
MNRKEKVVLQSLHVTEKTHVLGSLVDSESNPCVKKCKTAKYVFIVAPDANKEEIRKAVENIYKEQNIRVLKVNTINLPRKQKRGRGKMRMGATGITRKAIVTLREGDKLELGA